MMPRQITGRHVLVYMVLFFGVIIAANLTMAYFATGSWTGLVVENSYVASQQYNAVLADAERQKALGWKHEFSIEGGKISFTLKDAEGHLVPLDGVTIHAGHPATEIHDRTMELTKALGGTYEIPNDLPAGAWNFEIRAAVRDGSEWKVRYPDMIQEKAAN